MILIYMRSSVRERNNRTAVVPKKAHSVAPSNSDLTAGQIKQRKNEQKAKAHPERTAVKKEKNDAYRDRRIANGSSKSFA
jgi:hypothetical protein